MKLPRLKFSLTSDPKISRNLYSDISRRRCRAGNWLSCQTALALTIAIFSSTSLVVTAQTPPKRVHVTVLGTTDMHGNLPPIDYYTNTPDNRGLAKIATAIKRIEKKIKTSCS